MYCLSDKLIKSGKQSSFRMANNQFLTILNCFHLFYLLPEFWYWFSQVFFQLCLTGSFYGQVLFMTCLTGGLCFFLYLSSFAHLDHHLLRLCLKKKPGHFITVAVDFFYFLNRGQVHYSRKREYCNLKLQEQANNGHIRWLSFSACPHLRVAIFNHSVSSV